MKTVKQQMIEFALTCEGRVVRETAAAEESRKEADYHVAEAKRCAEEAKLWREAAEKMPD